MKVKVAARSSPLSKVQVLEVLQELHQHHPKVEFETLWMKTRGDKDLQTSLRVMANSDFFTYEVDQALLQGKCDIAIHSAKDLPNPLASGIALAAVTKGLPNGDSLVMRKGVSFQTLPAGAVIATSSERRENAIKELRSDLCFKDLRGNIGQRLELLENGQADGIVVADAALIRLGLMHLNLFSIPGSTTPLQGQLAITTRHDHSVMLKLFTCLDHR